MRYDSKYASHVASGAWRARKHKPLAAAARRAWDRMRKIAKGRLWMKHVKGHSGDKWNDMADSLADAGRSGVNVHQDALQGDRTIPDIVD